MESNFVGLTKLFLAELKSDRPLIVCTFNFFIATCLLSCCDCRQTLARHMLGGYLGALSVVVNVF